MDYDKLSAAIINLPCVILAKHGSAAQAVAKPYGWVYDDGHNEPRLSFKQMPSVLRGWTETPVFAAPPVADAEGAKWVDEWMGRNDVVLKQSAYRELCAALSRRPAAEQPAAAGNALTDEAIDQFNRDLCDTPFIFRRKLDKSGYEVIQMMNADWREVISDDRVVRWTGTDKEEGQSAWARLQTRWALAANPAIKQHLRAAPQAESVDAGYAQWMHNTSKSPHNDDRRHPFDAFKAGAEWAARAAPQAAQGEGLTPEVIGKLLRESNNASSSNFALFPYDFAKRIAAHTRASDGKDGERLEQMLREEYASYCEAVERHGVKPYTFNEYRAKAIEKIDAAMQQAASNQQEGA